MSPLLYLWVLRMLKGAWGASQICGLCSYGIHRKERKGRKDFLCSLRSLRPLRFSNCTGGKFVGRGRWFPPGRKRPGSGKDEALKRPSPPWPLAFLNGYRGEEGASSALRNLGQAVYGLAHLPKWAGLGIIYGGEVA